MKKHFTSTIAISVLATLVLSGCASYQAASLNDLSSEIFIQPAEKQEIMIAAKTFNEIDCERYLDRNVIKKGYQPIQLCIQNNSSKPYGFSLSRISLPYARPDEVAHKVHTSTVGRVLGYGIPGLIIVWPLLIPAIVDGIKSSEANELLDRDFAFKTARDQVILPYSHFNKIIFVPVHEYTPTFSVTVMDLDSNEQKVFNVTAQG